MSKLKLITTALLMIVLLIACSSDGDNETESEGNDPVTEKENNGSAENNDESDDSDSEDSDNDTTESDNEEKTSSSDGEILSLGETGVVESTLGEYEITFESFQLLDELEDQNNEDQIFIVLDVTVKNIGDEPLEGKHLYTSRLFDDEGTSQEATFYFESVDIMEGTIEPGDSMEGEFVFGARKSSESFELVYNHALSSLATELTWEFNVDEASN